MARLTFALEFAARDDRVRTAGLIRPRVAPRTHHRIRSGPSASRPPRRESAKHERDEMAARSRARGMNT
jgi:hypothetical protein